MAKTKKRTQDKARLNQQLLQAEFAAETTREESPANDTLDSVPSLILDTSKDDWQDDCLQETTEPPVKRTNGIPTRTLRDENSRNDRSPIRPSPELRLYRPR